MPRHYDREERIKDRAGNRASKRGARRTQRQDLKGRKKRRVRALDKAASRPGSQGRPATGGARPGRGPQEEPRVGPGLARRASRQQERVTERFEGRGFDVNDPAVQEEIMRRSFNRAQRRMPGQELHQPQQPQPQPQQPAPQAPQQQPQQPVQPQQQPQFGAGQQPAQPVEVPIDPATGQPIQFGATTWSRGVEAGVNPGQFGAVGAMAPPLMTPEAQMQPVPEAAGALEAGLDFRLQPPAVTPPGEVFHNPRPQTPEDVERMRQKRMQLLSQRMQQLRPYGRGLPQIRYGGEQVEPEFQR